MEGEQGNTNDGLGSPSPTQIRSLCGGDGTPGHCPLCLLLCSFLTYHLGILVPKYSCAWHQALGVIVKESNLSGKWPSEEVSFVFSWSLERMEKEFSAVQSHADTPVLQGGTPQPEARKPSHASPAAFLSQLMPLPQGWY